MSGWTEERIETLRRLVSERYSFGRIAVELGGVSRNACIAKATRLGIKSLNPQGIWGGETMRSAHRVATIRMPLPRFVSSGPEPEPLNVSFSEIANGQCRWPLGEPTHAMKCCGHPTVPGRPYCPHHYGVAFQKQTLRAVSE